MNSELLLLRVKAVSAYYSFEETQKTDRNLLVGKLDYQDIRDAKDRIDCAFEHYAQRIGDLIVYCVSNGLCELQDQASMEYKEADTIHRDLRTQYRAYMSKAKSISTRQSVLTTTNDIPVHGVRRSDQVVIDDCFKSGHIAEESRDDREESRNSDESGHIAEESRDNGDESRNNDESGHIVKETRRKREESRNKHELGHITDESKYSKDESEEESEHIGDKSRCREGQIKDESDHSADESRRSKGESWHEKDKLTICKLESKQTIRTGIGDEKHIGTDHERCASRRNVASSFAQSQLVQGGEFDQKEHM